MRSTALGVVLAVALGMVAMFVTTESAAANATDAQKSGQACTVCHTTPAGPALTSTGQAYLAGGRVWPIPAAQPAAPAAPAAPSTGAAPAPAQGKGPATLPATGEAESSAGMAMALALLGLSMAGVGLTVARGKAR